MSPPMEGARYCRMKIDEGHTECQLPPKELLPEPKPKVPMQEGA